MSIQNHHIRMATDPTCRNQSLSQIIVMSSFGHHFESGIIHTREGHREVSNLQKAIDRIRQRSDRALALSHESQPYKYPEIRGAIETCQKLATALEEINLKMLAAEEALAIERIVGSSRPQVHTCGICCEPIHQMMRLECGHVCCESCVRYLGMRCHICRQKWTRRPKPVYF